MKVTESELTKDDIKNFPEQPVNNDAQSSKSTPVYVFNPKQDLYGLGFDPYKHAPEFREMKRSRLSSKAGLGHNNNFSKRDSLFDFKSGKAAPGFGIGALEELIPRMRICMPLVMHLKRLMFKKRLMNLQCWP